MCNQGTHGRDETAYTRDQLFSMVRMPPPIDTPLVLLVEDDRDSREMYALGLELQGCRVTHAATAADALRACASIRPDVVVADLTLPDMDGLLLFRELRARIVDLPLIALTGRSGPDVVSQAVQEGARRVIVKPFPPDELAAMIRAVLAE